MGMATCNYMAKGKTKEDVMKMASEHGMKAHPKEAEEAMKKWTKEETMEMMGKNIKEEM